MNEFVGKRNYLNYYYTWISEVCEVKCSFKK